MSPNITIFLVILCRNTETSQEASQAQPLSQPVVSENKTSGSLSVPMETKENQPTIHEQQQPMDST